MLEKFWQKNVIDERVDWYSAAAVLYHLLTEVDAAALEGGSVSLPRKGVLENDAFRTDLEEALTRALRGMPYTEEEVREEQFPRDIQRLLFIASVQAAERPASPAARTPDGQPLPSADTPALLKALLRQSGAEASSGGDEMIAAEKMFTFYPEEEAEYRRQIQVLCQCLPGSKDPLETYTCHSLPHVQEVMREADRLFQAMRPWLSAFIPDGQMELARRYLLLGAKLHDIGMAGTAGMHSLMDITDQLYYHADGAGEKQMNVRAACRRLAALAESEGMETETCRRIVNAMPDGAIPAGALKHALSAYHDEIQKAIRKRHAETSGRYILAHREELSARYGREIDMGKTALIAALHSNSSWSGGEENGKESALSEAYCRRFLLRYGAEGESEGLCAPASLIGIFALATLLRVADTRRSGSNMRMIDLSPVSVDRTPGGRFVLYRIRQGVRENLPFSLSRSILLSEACCDFGAVSLTGGEEKGWHMIHDIKLRYADDASIRELFQSMRIPSYLEEFSSSLLEPTKKMTHELRVFAQGLDARAASAWAAQIQLPPGCRVTAVPDPS